MSKFTKYLLPLFLVALMGCENADVKSSSSLSDITDSSSNSSLINPSSSSSSSKDSSSSSSTTTDESSSSSSNEEPPAPVVYKVVLPEVNGVELSVSNQEPEVNENVKLYVKTLTPESRRVDAVKVNGIVLEGSFSNAKNVMIYEFAMPAEENAVVSIEIVDVWAISVAEEVKDYITLSYDTPEVAAEGETVSFRVASYAGFWFKSVVAVENDVILSEDNGVYSFIMPAHSVSITAITGTNVYSIVAEDTDYYWLTIKDSKVCAVAGDEVSVNVTARGDDTRITKVLVDGQELTINDDGSYSFVMPTHAVEVKCEYEIVYRTVETIDSVHFNLVAKTVVGEQEVEAANNVLSKQVVYLDVTEKEGLEAHQFLPDNFTFVAGDTAENAVEVTDISVKTESETNRSYFEMPNKYAYVKVSVTEIESYFKGTNLIGEYYGFKPQSSSSQSMNIDEKSVMKVGSYTYILEKVSENYYQGTRTNSTATIDVFVNPVDELVLVVEGNTTYTSVTLFGKKVAGSYVSAYSSRAYYIPTTEYGTELREIFVFAALGEVTEAIYYNYSTKEVVWNITKEVYSGVDGSTEGDIIQVKDSSGNLLKSLEVLTTGYYDYYYAKVKEVEIVEPVDVSAVVGMWKTDEYGDWGAGDVVVSVSVSEDGKAIVNAPDSSNTKLQNVEFTIVSSEEGVYTFNNETYGDLVIDASLLDTANPFVYVTYVLDSTLAEDWEVGGALYGDIEYYKVVAEETPSISYTGKTYQGTHSIFDDYNYSFSDYDFVVTFIDTENVSFELYGSTRTGTYTISEDGVIIVSTTNIGSFSLTPQADGSLKPTLLGSATTIVGMYKIDFENCTLTYVSNGDETPSYIGNTYSAEVGVVDSYTWITSYYPFEVTFTDSENVSMYIYNTTRSGTYVINESGEIVVTAANSAGTFTLIPQADGSMKISYTSSSSFYGFENYHLDGLVLSLEA